MSARTTTPLAWGLAALACALLLSGFVLTVASGSRLDFGRDVFIWAMTVAFAGVGALVASRHPGNAIGWTLLGVAVALGVAALTASYGEYWVGDHGGSETLGKAAAWYANLSWVPFILVPATFLLLLFPDGRLLSRRWRWIARCAALGIAGTFVVEGLRPGRIDDFPQVTNPYGVDSPLLVPSEGLAFVLLVIGIVGSAASLIVRFRRARGVQRQQIKWLAYAGGVAAVAIPITFAGSGLWGDDATSVVSMVTILGLPVAAGIAILRHRLYDIDVVINRTLVYGSLTATLAAAYLGSVLLLQLVLSGVTEGSGLAVAASTLAVAALFRPARVRFQATVDRRFYRRKYDAARTIEAFNARLRDQVELGSLSAELRTVVVDAMQPSHVSLWLRSEEPTR